MSVNDVKLGTFNCNCAMKIDLNKEFKWEVSLNCLTYHRDYRPSSSTYPEVVATTTISSSSAPTPAKGQS
ncbi:hypothetical protein V6N13_006091 [Hibiscus sabdariffa]